MELSNDPNVVYRKIEYACQLNPFSGVDGSALFSQNDSIMVVSIYGPEEATSSNMFINKANINVTFTPQDVKQNPKDTLIEKMILNILEASVLVISYPRTNINVKINEMQNHGQRIACAVNAVCMSFLNSGILMKFSIGAVTCVINPEGKIIVNPKPWEEKQARAYFFLVFENTEYSIVSCYTEGTFEIAEFNKVVDICQVQCEKLFSFYKTQLGKIICKVQSGSD